MSTDTIRYEQRDSVALITMDDGKANALGPASITALTEALDRAERDAKAVVLAGRAGRFSAGFDLSVMMSSPELARSLVMSGAHLFLRVFEHPQPLIAACTGHALAGGAIVLLGSDRRIGAAGAFKIGLNETTIGMPLPIFAHALAKQCLDPRRLLEATLHGTVYDPEGAREVGYLDRVVPAERVLDEALAEATRLAPISGTAYRITKKTLRGPTAEYVRQTLEEDMLRFRVGG